jgi:hypothetical protein
MSIRLELLPFNFRQIPTLNKWLLTGLSGAFTIIDSINQLEAIIEGEYERLPPEVLNDLTAKSFFVYRLRT